MYEGDPCPKHRARGVNPGCPDCDSLEIEHDEECADELTYSGACKHYCPIGDGHCG